MTCETAKTKRCRCRCGGRLHGAGRLSSEAEARQLDEQDPHHASDPADAKLRRALHRAVDSLDIEQPALWPELEPTRIVADHPGYVG
jgi:Ser/Thr protein kinase RdoA (MazF antagonist)